MAKALDQSPKQPIPKCLYCGYSLEGLKDRNCPECGATAIEQELRLATYKRFSRGSWNSFFFSLLLMAVGTCIVLLLGDDRAKFAYFTPSEALFSGGILSLVLDIFLYGIGLALPCAQLLGANRMAVEKVPRKQLWGRSLAWTTAPFWVVITPFCVMASLVEFEDWHSGVFLFGLPAVLLLSLIWLIVWIIRLRRHARSLGINTAHVADIAIAGTVMICAIGVATVFMVIFMSAGD